MTPHARQHVIYRLLNATPSNYPFPHVWIENIFPNDTFRDLLAALPPVSEYQSIAAAGRVTSDKYPNRSVLDFDRPDASVFPEPAQKFWQGLLDFMLGSDFSNVLLGRFGELVKGRFQNRLQETQFHTDLQLVNDVTNYTLGPHTDNPQKVAVILFYLPDDDAHPELGTSIYVPRQPGFRCDGLQHHETTDFDRVITLPYKPNTAFAFFKSGRSFHGVEPVHEDGVQRRLIQLSVRHQMRSDPVVAPVT